MLSKAIGVRADRRNVIPPSVGIGSPLGSNDLNKHDNILILACHKAELTPWQQCDDNKDGWQVMFVFLLWTLVGMECMTGPHIGVSMVRMEAQVCSLVLLMYMTDGGTMRLEYPMIIVLTSMLAQCHRCAEVSV